MPPPRPNTARTIPPPSDFPPYRPFPIDRLGRVRSAFRQAGWRVLPGYLPRVTMPGWVARRRLDANHPNATPAPSTEPPTPEALDGMAGPEPDRCLTAVHPEGRVAVTVERQEAGYEMDYSLWWEGEYASDPNACRVPAPLREEIAAILIAADPFD